jgi:hypothetical protein
VKTDIIFNAILPQLASNWWWWVCTREGRYYQAHTPFLNKEFGIPSFVLEYMARKGTNFPHARRKWGTELINSNKGYK